RYRKQKYTNAEHLLKQQQQWQQNAEDELKTSLTLEALGETLSPQQKTLYEAGFKKEVATQLLKSPAATTAMKNAEALGLEVGSPEYIEYVRMATTPKGSNITVSNVNEATEKGNIEWKKSQAKSLADNVARHRENTSGNRVSLDRLNRLAELNRRLKSRDGLEGESLQWANNQLRSWGFDADITGQGATLDEAIALTNKLTLDEMSKQKGPQTDQDREFIKTTVPNINQSHEARQQLTEYMQSRLMLDDAHMNTLGGIHQYGTLDESLSAYGDADKKYRSVPAGVVLNDGSSVTFKTYYDSIGGGDINVAVDRWLKAIEEDKAEAKAGAKQ
ncbi:MAG: hypothetical protein DRQ40_08940, partial [Gammaproteobacteria bacterium]